MYIVLVVMLVLACLTLFYCGYYLAVIKEKMGRSVLIAIPITIGIFMFNVIWALVELGKSPHWQ
ncbi:hypothetical protein [Bacillus sp. T3]|uniref:hypothetical protein n=1 Tax=Bacillus sp. T3 TaxID=467262 RepID=UPI002981075C|nr:hypothetical protein [Bacillus sp. T3]